MPKKEEKKLVKCQLTNIQYSKKTSYSYFTNHIHYISKKLTTKDQNPMDIGHDSQIPRIRARSTLPHSAQWEVLPIFVSQNIKQTKPRTPAPCHFIVSKNILD